MQSVRHLRQKKKELQAHYELLSQKITRLRNELAIQAGTKIIFQLEKEVENSEQERDKISRNLEAVEKRLGSEQLHYELSRLNYIDQVTLFREFVEERWIGAFLVHGQEEHGQLFLIKRLLKSIPFTIETPLVELNLARRALRTNIDALWRELGRSIEAQDLSSREEIARQAIAQLNSQHLILIVHDLDCVDETYLEELVKYLWKPLSSMARKTFPHGHEFYLLMFLVDQDGCVGTWNTCCVDQLDTDWEPYIPIRLPKLDRLSETVLVNWIENAIDTLPINFTKKIRYSVDLILEKSEGVPERVFAQVFNLCGCSWQEGEDRWLKL